jgi:hypothetical protein
VPVPNSSDQTNIHFRELRLYLDRPFKGLGEALRLAITGAFPDRSVLHNHKGDSFDYRSPQVRYLVLNGIPRLISFHEGLHVLEEIYRSGPDPALTLRVRNTTYEVRGVELCERIEPIGLTNDLITYRSISPWLGLNQENYRRFKSLNSQTDRKSLLTQILVGNYLSLCKWIGLHLQGRILLTVQHYQTTWITVNRQRFQAFRVQFVSNILIPEFIGLGKMVSKGYGIFRKG